MRTSIYVDGLNLYYRCLRKSAFKWLDLNQLFSNLLDAKYKIDHINYYYANVKSLPDDPSAPDRQGVYLRAIKTLNNVHLVQGDFTKRKVEMRLWSDPFAVVEVMKVEEKGSDVNLATNLLNDAWTDVYDVAFVVSQDPDLKEGMRLVKQEFPQKEVNLITPGPRRKACKELRDLADHHLEIRPKHLKNAQFPDKLPAINIIKPPSW
ncbi:MAG: NYN domain-containing protein [Alphaproteobacteria bacterium]|nr:NYN domain-containing protein [Alphaproteobacteria bacterium]